LLFARKSFEQVRERITEIVRLASVGLVFVLIMAELFAATIISAILGGQFLSGVGIFRLTVLGVLPWGLYVVLKSAIDAWHWRPINARNIMISFVSFLIFTGAGLAFFPTVVGIMLAFVLSLYVIALLTAYEIRRILRGMGGAAAAG
jgi:O-antigen/teichoic acid export membrane protein